MITIYNSNLDFDLGSSNSITLSSTSNMVFKTNGTDKMSIVDNGISVSGNVVVSGLITSTGAGFSGIGAGLSNIPISAINELRLELNGGTTDLSVTRDTLNARIVSEIGFGSNYTNRINSELNTRVDNTSNYVLATSNILIGRIINTSNYVDSTSNFLSGRIDNTSNYALATSNILIGRIINTSNYVDSTSNFLAGRIDNTSNYALATSNILIGRIINTSNYVDSTSNFLSGRIDNTSNYALATSNILIGRIINTSNYVESTSNTLIGRVINTSNYVESTSNTLIGRIDNTSNYVLATSNILIGRLINTSNYVDSTSNFLSGRIDNTSNYVLATSNILIGRIINTSNYVESTSNFLSGRIDNTSNYVLSTSNILVGRLINASNYVESTSNILIGRIINTSNYVDRINTALTTAIGLKQDILTAANTIGVLNTTTDFVVNGSKIELTKNTSNYVDRINTALTTAIGLKQDILTAANTIGVLNTTTDFVVNGSKIELTKNTSNYVDRINTALTSAVGLKQDILTAANTIGVLNTTTDFVVSGSKIELTKNTSNYVLATSNILIGRIMNTSNYVSSYKPATAVKADTADKLTTSRKIANVPFDGTADINIPYNNLNNILVASTGINIDANNYISATYASADLISIFNTTDFANVNSKIELSKNTSNYVLATSNILIGHVINTSNYVDRINTTLTTAIAGKQNTLSAGSGISIVGNQISASASAQVQSDWNATSGVSFILNKPSIPATLWEQYGSDTYYKNNTTGNVGIGTYLTETFSRLHLYSANYSETKLTIQNNYSASPSGLIYSTLSPLIRTTGSYTYMIFYYTTSGTGGAGVGQTRYNITIPTGGSTIDILMVGGGGNGGSDIGGGGGGGAVLYGTNITIPAGSYNIDIGNGGVANGENGYSTTAFGATCLGGGAAKNKTFDSSGNNDGNTGGSGGGGKSYNQVGPAGAGGTVGTSTKGTLLAAATLYNGNVGGVGSAQGGGYITSGGGGGANGEGKSAKSGSNPSGTGNGGDGVAVNITGSTYYWGAGGGSGSFLTPAGNGGLGGGGAGTGSGSGGTNGNVGTNALNTASGMNAASMSGSGGGGGSFTAGGAGGSGVVIIKYSLNSTTSSIEFIRGTSSDSNMDYKIGNYTGEFKIISSVSNSDTDFVKITPNGGISNPTGTSSWTTTSDRRIKENIEKASYDICYDNINKLDLYRFNYIRNFNNVNKDVRQLGYIAQEVKEIFPKAVSSHNFTNNDINIPDLLSIDITQINYSLYGAVKKLIEMNEDNLFRIKKLIEIDEDKENRIKNLEFALNTSNILII